MKLLLWRTLALSLVLSFSGVKAETTVSSSFGTSLTIYNQNFGLVKDIRSLTLSEGLNDVRFEDVASQIDPTTVSFQSLTAPNSVTVREQNYQYDLIDTNTILAKSVGKPVKFKQFLPGGGISEISGTLLNSPLVTVADPHGGTATRHQGLVVKTDAGVVLNPAGQVELAELPSGLIAKPSLLWKLEAGKGGEHKTEIAYQTAGMNWHADYVAVVNKDDTQADLTSWVTIDNKSGAGFKSASLKLIAGDVHKVRPVVHDFRAKGQAVMEMSAAPQFTEQSFAEYHLYTLQGKTDVNNNETKQMSLFSANQVPVKKLFVFEGAKYSWGYPGDQGKRKVQIKFEIANTEKNQLGMPMPKGKVRVYKRDADGALQFIGEDEIDHTPKDEKIRVYIGDAFDLVAERKQTSMSQVSSRVQRMSYQIDLRNHRKESATVMCVEHAWGDWTILRSSHPYTKKDAQTFEFNVEVPKDGETIVTYDIEIRH